MRSTFFRKLAYLAEKHAGLTIVCALIITLFALFAAQNLRLEMQFKNMMPVGHPTVQEYNQILESFDSASNIIIAAQGPEQDLKQFAETIAPHVLAMQSYIKRVDYKIPHAYIRNYGLLLQKTKNLKNSRTVFQDLGLYPFITHLNDNFEKTYVEDEESISNKEKENQAVQSLDGIAYWLQTMQLYVEAKEPLPPQTAMAAVDRFLYGDEYYISQDKDMILLFAQPRFSSNDVGTTMLVVDSLNTIIAEMETQFPQIDAGLTGTMALIHDETKAASEDMFSTSIIGFTLIILLFILSFRMLVAPLLSGITLLIGVIWSAGFAALTIGSLNMMTSMFAVVLMGLGIDFSIHIISAYTENRAQGMSISAALTETFSKSGNGIVVGALTTALAFFTMLISSNAGMKEFGFIAGSGVIFCMLSTILVLPSLLVLREKWSRKKVSRKVRPFELMGNGAEAIGQRPKRFLILTLLITIFLGYCASQIKFDYNYLNLEPEGLESIRFQDAMIAEFDATPDMVMVTAASIDEAREITEAAKDLASVGMVTSISEYLPTAQNQAERKPYLQQIQQYLEQPASIVNQHDLDALIEELYRIEDNVIELAQLAFVGGQDKVDQKAKSITGDLQLPIEERKSMITALVEAIEENPDHALTQLQAFQAAYEPDFRNKAQRMATHQQTEFSNLTPEILNQFTNNNQDQFLVSIYPKKQAWDFQFLSRFTDQIHRINPRITGMPPIFYILIKLIGKDGTIAALLTLLVVFLLLWFDFRSVKLALLGMVPLLFGVAWMLGLMHLFGLKLNIVNTIGVPLILGMGIDDGVHILHRFKAEGKRNLHLVFASTGKAIFLTSATTMLAFGSLGFAVYRGLASLGITLFIGIFTCFMTTVLILPALLGGLFKTQK